MEKHLTIRQETPDNFKEVFEVNAMAFRQDNEANLIDALRKNPTVFIPELSIVATKNDKVLGYILFTKIKIRDGGGNLHESLGLAPMAVRPEFQNMGIGGQLIEHGLNKARELQHKSVIVLGHEQYYPKFGFTPAGKWNIRPPFEVRPNVFMAIELVKDGLKKISGTVIYPKEFETI